MRSSVGFGCRLAVMTAVVATMLYWPIGIAVVLVCALIGIPAQALITFGGVLGTLAGMLAWWLLVFALTLPYAASVFPWGGRMDGFHSAGDETPKTRNEEHSWPKKR